MAKKKPTRKSQQANEPTGLQNIISNEKTDFLFGIILAGISIYTIIAFVSFLNTGQADQSLLEDLRPGEWLNKDNSFQNYCGSIGAILSYILITKNFGLSSFLIPVFFLALSAKLMRIFYRVNLWKWFLSLTVVMVWSSVTFAKFLTPIMGDCVYNPGGNHGLFCVQFLQSIIGSPGLILILCIVALVFLTYLSAETINMVRRLFNPIGYLMAKIKVTVTNDNDSGPDDVNSGQTDETPAPAADTTDYEDTAYQPETGNENAPTVVDLTHYPEQEPEQEAAQPLVRDGQDSNVLTVDVGQSEKTATVSTLGTPEDLHTPINPKEPFTRYKYPTLDLLKKYGNERPVVDMEEIKANNARIVEVLSSFGVTIKEIHATVGPTITLYEITPGEGQRISKIKNLEDDIALNLSALGIRIIAPMPGKGTIGIEVPNKKPNIVSMESILNSRKFQETKFELPLALGKTITNEVYMVDLAKIPHLLVAGATGKGKSVGLNAIIASLLYKKHPNELKIVLVDPKKVEFSVYAPIADHFMMALPENMDEPIITDVNKVVRTLNSLCVLMDHRYDMLKQAKVRNIKEYNEKFINRKLDLSKGHEYMPYIVVIIDEFGDLIMTAGRDVEKPICRIAQLARAVGIHMVIATQRPTVNIITGTIRANFPGRIAFQVASMVDSRTILDRPGANQLVGKGDMLFLNGGEPVRVQCAFVDTPEVERINEHIMNQPGPVEPLSLPEPATEDGGGGASANGDMGCIDPLFEEVAHYIVSSQQGSTSMIQRRYSIGYNRAGRLMDQMEKAGIVGAAQGARPREVLVSDETQLGNILSKVKG